MPARSGMDGLCWNAHALCTEQWSAGAAPLRAEWLHHTATAAHMQADASWSRRGAVHTSAARRGPAGGAAAPPPDQSRVIDTELVKEAEQSYLSVSWRLVREAGPVA